MKRGRLPGAVLRRVILRSFFLQASWNFERLQSLGVLYALAPALRILHQGRELACAFHRHLEYFNTHPFMASTVMGTVLALEEEASDSRGFADVQEFKRMVMAPYAAIGDALFWGGLRPIASGIALFIAAREWLWAPVVFLVLFNLPHLWFRIRGFLRGYTLGMKVVEVIQCRHLPDVALRLKEGTVILLGGLCAYLTFLCLQAEALAAGWGLAAVPAVVLGGKLVGKRLSILLLILAVSTLILGMAWFF